MASEIVTIVFVGVIGVALFLALRSIVLWYFCIPELISVLEEIRDRLPKPKPVASPAPVRGPVEKWVARSIRA
jgi:hypothetical protein